MSKRKRISRKGTSKKRISRKGISKKRISRKEISRKGVSKKEISKKGISRKGISRKRTSRKGISRKRTSRKEISRKGISVEYLNYKNKMDKLPNDTVLSRWGMYCHDKRYKDETAKIVKMIMDDMHINENQAYYMLYYMTSNNITDYERAKLDMYIDENFEIYRTKRKKEV